MKKKKIMRLLIYRNKGFPNCDLILPACKLSKRYCASKNKETINIEDLKELEKKGYEFKHKIEDWKNLQVIPVKGN